MSDAVILLFGGTSTERRVSVASAQNLVSVLGGAELWFCAPDEAVHRCSPDEVLAHQRPFEQDFAPAAPAVWPRLAEALDAAPRDAVLFLGLHGGQGENGVLQRTLEERGFAFTGSGSAASALAFDKVRAKEAAAGRGVKVARASTIRGSANEVGEALSRLLGQLGRLAVKPVAEGSSFGLHFVAGAEDVGPVAEAVARSGLAYLVEEFISGVELTVGVVEEGGRAVPLPPSEVRVDRGAHFDYAGKYLGRGTREITPAEVPAEVTAAAQQAALAAHAATGCEGYSRTDLIATGGDVVFLEINTLPGLTRMSFIPQQLQASGRTLEDFAAHQLRLAAERRDRGRRPG